MKNTVFKKAGICLLFLLSANAAIDQKSFNGVVEQTKLLVQTLSNPFKNLETKFNQFKTIKETNAQQYPEDQGKQDKATESAQYQLLIQELGKNTASFMQALTVLEVKSRAGSGKFEPYNDIRNFFKHVESYQRVLNGFYPIPEILREPSEIKHLFRGSDFYAYDLEKHDKRLQETKTDIYQGLERIISVLRQEEIVMRILQTANLNPEDDSDNDASARFPVVSRFGVLTIKEAASASPQPVVPLTTQAPAPKPSSKNNSGTTPAAHVTQAAADEDVRANQQAAAADGSVA